MAALLALLCLLIYLPTLSPSVVIDDGGELQMLAYRQGVAHPTGYPLFTLIGGLFAHLPILGGDVGWRVTLFCTLSSAAAAGLLYLLARQLETRRTPAAAAALLLAAAPRVWMHAQATEVYALGNFFMLLGLWLLLRWEHGKTPLWAVTLAFGFGLTHHIFLRLVGPGALLYVLAVQPRLPLRPRVWLPAVAALLLPLLLYAFIPLRAEHFLAMPELAGSVAGVRKVIASGLVTPHYFGGGLANLALALDYTGQFLGGQAQWGTAARQYGEMTLQQMPWPGVLLALLGVVVLLRRQPRASLLLLVTYVIALAAALQFLARVGEDGDNFIPVYLLMAVWFAVGADAALAWLHQRWPRLRLLFLALLWLLPLAHVVSQYPAALARRQMETAPQARSLLAAPLSSGAVLAGDWSDITPLRYMQQVEGLRRDLWIIHAGTEGLRDVLIPAALADRQPLYVLRRTPAGFRLLPTPLYGPPAPALPATEEDASSPGLRLTPAVRWLGYDLAPAEPRAGDVLALTLYWAADAAPESDWSTFIHLVDAQGEKLAQVDRVPVGPFFPPSAWQPGLALADQYELSLPGDLAPGSYQLLFGAYSGDRRFAWEDGQSVRILTVIQVR